MAKEATPEKKKEDNDGPARLYEVEEESEEEVEEQDIWNIPMFISHQYQSTFDDSLAKTQELKTESSPTNVPKIIDPEQED